MGEDVLSKASALFLGGFLATALFRGVCQDLREEFFLGLFPMLDGLLLCRGHRRVGFCHLVVLQPGLAVALGVRVDVDGSVIGRLEVLRLIDAGHVLRGRHFDVLRQLHDHGGLGVFDFRNFGGRHGDRRQTGACLASGRGVSGIVDREAREFDRVVVDGKRKLGFRIFLHVDSFVFGVCDSVDALAEDVCRSQLFIHKTKTETFLVCYVC